MGPTRSKIHDLVSTSSFRPRALSLQERWCSWPSPRRQTCFARAWQARGSIHADFPVVKTPTYFMETVCNHHFREPPVVRTANGAKRSDKPPLSLKRKPATSAPGAGRRQRNVSDSPGSFCGALRSRYAGESSARLPLTVVLPYPFIRNHHTCFFLLLPVVDFRFGFLFAIFAISMSLPADPPPSTWRLDAYLLDPSACFPLRWGWIELGRGLHSLHRGAKSRYKISLWRLKMGGTLR